ncbi:hypothetical protein H0A36_13920 [Endozoicomonas sp. SM1973]|uniref:Uncharacterized protein n=1 Tax=Spartinivicinus marinus TaxID=2994442 RepID=A0A853I133_9GAMM|nr:hypothetical protein [Spartinivicinus marinus]MCX4028621.1 hypothetical protein [Spartinivicinus marinus]NYZ67113.1 hypothetical protein [Spartinivicinus marinus]
MGVEYILVNETKREMISFNHLNGSKKRELAGNSVQSAIVTWYLLSNQGDQIQFVSDTYSDWPFNIGSRDSVWEYIDKTEELINTLISQGILQDNGMLYVDEDEPESIYVRDIKNIW